RLGPTLHLVEEFLADDLAVLHGVEADFLEVRALARHRPRLRREVVLEEDGEAIAVGEGPFDIHLVDLVVLHPPLVLADDRVPAVHLGGTLGTGLGLEPHRLGAEEGLHRLDVLLLPTQVHELLSDFQNVHCRLQRLPPSHLQEVRPFPSRRPTFRLPPAARARRSTAAASAATRSRRLSGSTTSAFGPMPSAKKRASSSSSNSTRRPIQSFASGPG